MFLNILHITAHLSRKEWNNYLGKISRWSKPSNSSQQHWWGFRQIISTSSKYEKHKYEDTSGRHLRFFITTHPTSCLRLYGETHALGTGRQMQNKRSVTKSGSHRPFQTLQGMGSIQCKDTAQSTRKVSVPAPLQPLTDSNEHLRKFSHRLGLPLPWQLINLKRRMKTLFRFTVSKKLLVSLCHSSIPQKLRKLVKCTAPMYLETTCRKLSTFLFILCFNVYKFCPSLILPCEIILINSYQIPCCILLW